MKTFRTLLPLLSAAALAAAPLFADSLVTTDAFLPIVHIVGATGTYVSDVNVFNPNTAAVEVRFYYTAADTDGTSSPGFRLTPDLNDRESYTIQDALPTLFHVSSGYGLLEVQSSQPIIVTSNTINIAANCTGGTFGQFSPGQPERNSIGYGTTNDYDLYVAGIPYDAFHRTNAVLMNPSSAVLHATMELVDGNGGVLGHIDSDVPPFSLHQLNDVFSLFAAAHPAFNASWRLNFYVRTNNGARLLAYITISDTRSGDPYLVTASAQLVDVPGRPAPVPDGAERAPSPISRSASSPAPRTVLDTVPVPPRR